MDVSQWDASQWDADQWEAAGVWASIAVTFVIAILGWARSVRAGRRAKTAIWHSVEALELARSAEDRAERLEGAVREHRDVEWSHVVDHDADVVRFRNTGTTAAYDVEIALDRRDLERASVTADVVQPLQQLEIPGVPMYDAIIAAHAEGETVRSPRLVPGKARITWHSAAGIPSIDLRDVP